ncbi:uncharacterized protein LOC121876549 [Homarus americanus]|uniref:uncharacterized protein LOC121876549 n=1 Tax=Homarus americanus TaxID=6706 RepID=UPI001C478AEF|nr:uncharacterized protein LOC121876549 [Homarus americanus]
MIQEDNRKSTSPSPFYHKCTPALFVIKTTNGECINRPWLCFSPNTNKVYCFVCKLVSTKDVALSTTGFCDWKHATESLFEHETSKPHLEAVRLVTHRGRTPGHIHEELEKQETEAWAYWTYVLKRVVSTIKFIAERGLAFCGNDELVDSPTNGNYLGILELISEYDNFLAAHIKVHANKGTGHTSYLSSTICEEIIAVMGENVLREIVSRIRQSKYFSVSVDSTPDEAHIDQLTVII